MLGLRCAGRELVPTGPRGGRALVTALLVLFGAYDQISGPSTILTLPEAA